MNPEHDADDVPWEAYSITSVYLRYEGDEEPKPVINVTCQGCHTTYFMQLGRCPKCRKRCHEHRPKGKKQKPQQAGKPPQPVSAFLTEVVGVKKKKLYREGS